MSYLGIINLIYLPVAGSGSLDCNTVSESPLLGSMKYFGVSDSVSLYLSQESPNKLNSSMKLAIL